MSSIESFSMVYFSKALALPAWPPKAERRPQQLRLDSSRWANRRHRVALIDFPCRSDYGKGPAQASSWMPNAAGACNSGVLPILSLTLLLLYACAAVLAP